MKNEEIKASDPLAKMAIVAQAICRMDRKVLYQEIEWQQQRRRGAIREMKEQVRKSWKSLQEKT